MAKGRVEQHIANAAVQLAAGDTAGAAKEQKKVKDVLDKIGKSLGDASGARAGDLASALRRAKNDAADAKTKLGDMKAAQAKGTAKGEEKKQAAEEMADDLARLNKQLQARDFGKGDKAYEKAAKALGDQTKDPTKLADELAKVDAKVDQMQKVAAVLQIHLEAEYDSTLKSQELFAAQREDCPPQYRPLVNQYFESLSSTGH
jgi:chromosome segregation ATPase